MATNLHLLYPSKNATPMVPFLMAEVTQDETCQRYLRVAIQTAPTSYLGHRGGS